ncbi:beta strand repeat-containing protein [Allosphingosinicella indica]|uniref:C-type lectin domain-containing protein n=1 Tax=Allosphingosinicella indica TaxID=941907 RepID=A0A1X7GJQ7_9SPHN|nr:lectin-like protein [Allosphingosinicella indica]SMF70825.1 hypothetical protein SAMN06295910_1952 [Allosphingosinicella indica]
MSSRALPMIRRKSLLSSCAVAAIATLAWTPPAAAQLLGTPTVVRGSADVDTDPSNITGIAPRTIINWNDAPTTALPSGNTVNYSGTNDYIVLNRILPTDNSLAVRLDGTVNSTVNGVRGGQVWFYSPTGVIAGNGSQFNVGSLLLTANDLTDFAAFEAGSDTFTFARGNSNAAVVIEPGAEINAGLGTNGNNYVALVAPRVRQGGSVRVEGSAAYVAAEQVDIRISGSLFDISFSNALGGTAATGTTTEDAAVVHEGTTILETGYGTPVGSTRDAIMVAVPKNDAVTMLVTGAVTYNAASGASLDSTGRIILSGGYDFTENNVRVGTGAVNIDVNGGSYGTGNRSGVAYDTTIRATGDVSVVTSSSVAFGRALTVDSLGAASLTASGLGNSITAGGTMTVTGLSDASVTAFSGGQVNASGAIRLRSPVSASLAARDGSVINANGGIELDATANGTTDNPNATGGTASVIAENGSSISASYIEVNASASGGVDADGNGGSGTGGTASIIADQGGEIFANYTDAIANGFGGSSLGGRGGDGTGGSATLRAANGGSINASIETYVYAYGEGGNGSTGPGGGFGGSVTLAADGGYLSAPGYRLDASGTGGEMQTESGYGPSTLGLGEGGIVTVRTTADEDGYGGLIDVFSGGEGGGSGEGGFLTIDASGNGNSFGGEGGSSSFFALAAAAGGTGGTINMDIGGAGLVAGDLSLDVSGSGGNGLPGDDPDMPTAGGSGQGGTINLNFVGGDSSIGTLNLTANGTGGSASTDLGGSGSGGLVNLGFQGGTVEIGTATLTANGRGGASGVGIDGYGLGGADGNGGTINVALTGGTGAVGSLFADASGTGGRGGDGVSSEGRADGGFGGTGRGGFVTLSSSTPIDIASINLSAAGQGGRGGDAAVGDDRIGGFGGSGGTGSGGTVFVDLLRDDLISSNLTASATGTGGRGGAGDNFFTDDHSYFVITSSRSWDEALAEAQQYGNGQSTGYLAAINSPEENALLALYLSYYENLDGMWLGGSDAGSEGTFTWRGGSEAGNPLGFTNWAPGQPDNLGGAENYIVFDKSGQWGDATGGAVARRGYFVEFDTSDFSFNDGTGGFGQGGTVFFNATGNNVAIDTIALSANGIGGEGGANFDSPNGYGGTGAGGFVNFSAGDLGLTTERLTIAASGIGGNSLDGAGSGSGGTALFSVFNSNIAITGASDETNLLIEANGSSGFGRFSGVGSGGTAQFDMTGGTFAVAGSAAVRASQPIDPDGIVTGGATGGYANIVVSAGGTLTVEQQLLADASAVSEVVYAAQGGIAGIRSNGGAISALRIDVDASATSESNPDFSYGGNATGGLATLDAFDGGFITSTEETVVSAYGRAGDMRVDGRGIGGTIDVNALGGTIQASNLALDATGRGSGYTFSGSDISGGMAQGGRINITVSDSLIGTGQITATNGVVANASATASESGYGIGSGGDAQGGDINIAAGSGGVTTSFLGLYASGSGGNDGVGTLAGGNGTGGNVTLDFTGGTQSLSAVEINVRGSGGDGNDNGEQGGDGGAGTGGNVIIRASGGTGTIGSLDIGADGFGGQGASSFTGGEGSAGPLAGGRGGDGTGGTITLTATGGATLTLPSYDGSVNGFGGSGGSGNDAGYGTGTIGGAGGAGGNGTGGGIILSVNDGTLILGDGDSISFAAEGGGGGGGSGGDGDPNSGGLAGGIGGAGGNGLGGAITVSVVGGAILGGNGNPADLNLRSIGFSGFGGEGGFSNLGIYAGDGAGGNAAGGDILISAFNNGTTRSNVTFGNASLVSGGESGGTETTGSIRIDVIDSDIAFGAIDINLFGSDTTTPVAPSGFTTDGGTISASGPVSVQTPRDFYVDAANGGTTSMLSTFSAIVGGLFSSNSFESGGVPTLQADGLFVNAGDIRTTGDSLLSSTEDLELLTGNSIAVNALSAGGSIFLAGNDGAVPGTVTVASADAGEDVDIDSTGNITAGSLTAGRDVLLRSGGGIQVTTAQAGDDIEANATGAISFASATTTGLGEDSSESGYGAGDGSNIRLTGTTVRLDNGDAVDGIFLTANSGDVNSAGLLRADTLTVNAVTNIALNDLDIVNAIDLTTTGGSITGGDFQTGSFISLNARDDVRIGSASAGSFIGLFAGGTASADSLTGGSIFVDAGTVDIGTARADFGLTLLADGLLTLDDGEAESFFGRGADVNIGSITTFGTSLSGEGFGGLAIEATGNTNVQNASSATFVSIDTGTLDAGTLTAADDVIVNAAGNIVIQSATAGRDVLLDSGGAINVVAARAGDDIEANAAGAISFGTATTTGLGEDASESGYGAGDGSNIRLAGSTVRLDTGTAIDGIYLTAETGAVNSAGLLTADTLDVSAATDIALNDAAIRQAINLTTTGGSISGRDFSTSGSLNLDSSAGITLASASVGGDASFTAAGDIALGSVNSGGGITATGANIGLQQADAGNTIRLNAVQNINVGTIVVRGDFLADAGGNFTGTSVTTLAAEGGGQNSDGRRIGTLAIDPDGNGISIATGGNIVLNEGNSAGAILLDAGGTVSAGTLVSNGNLGASGATGVTIGVIDAAGDVDLRAERGAIIVTDDLRATGNVDAAGQAVTLNAVENLAVRSVIATAGDIRLNAGNDLSVASADASGTFAANAGNVLSFSGTTNAARITLASRDIAIGENGRIGTSGRTQSIAITANGAGTPVVIGGSGTGEGYRLDNAEFGRLAARDISFTGDGSGLSIEALDIRGANADNPNVTGRLSIADAGDVELVGAVRFNNASADNVLSIGSGQRFFLDVGSGSVWMTNGNALAGTFQVQARSILMSSRAAAADLAGLNTIAARNERLGRNDGPVNLDGYVRAGAIRLAAVDGIYTQNSGANSANPDDRAGLTAGEGGFTIINLGQRPLDLILNGRQVTSGGTVTGAALIARLQAQGGSPGAPFYAAGSTVNGCIIGGSNCGTVIEPEPQFPPIIIPVQDVIDRVLDDEDDSDDALTRPPAPNNELIRIVGYPFAPVIDEPVTGAGNDDLWSMSLPGGFDPNLPPSTIDTQVTGSGNDTLINDQTRGSQNQSLVDTPVTGAGNEGPVTQP